MSALPRVLEPEVMDTAEDARAYDEMQHAEVNAAFVSDLLALSPDVSKTLDVGTGSGRIPLELARRVPEAKVVGIDMSKEMLALARKHAEREKLADRLVFEEMDAKGILYEEGAYTTVMSNSLLHHVPDPRAVVAEMVRVVAPLGTLFVRDLFRPDDERTLTELVATYAKDEDESQRKLFAESLHAALTVEELEAIVASIGMTGARIAKTSDRHLTLVWQRTV
jgi:ubiquinone/menaquinone biosynthesis C-methylase UbiE